MEREDRVPKAIVSGVDIEYEVSGDGEPVVFVAGALIADAFLPLVAEPALAHGFKLITYHRRGYGESGYVAGSIGEQATDCMELLRHVGVERTHVVGHSFGGAVALQLAMDSPEAVHSLALLEPALFAPETGEAYRAALAQGEHRFRDLPTDVAVDGFLEARLGPGYRVALEHGLPGAFAQAVEGARPTFELDLPALRAWELDEGEVRQLTLPVMNVIGSESEALWGRFGEVYRLVASWMPQAEGFVLPGAAHFHTIQNPRGMAEALSDFWQRHPIGG